MVVTSVFIMILLQMLQKAFIDITLYDVGNFVYGWYVESIHALSYAMYSTPIVVVAYRAYIISHGCHVFDAYNFIEIA